MINQVVLARIDKFGDGGVGIVAEGEVNIVCKHEAESNGKE
jgi:hypothetical protein